MKLLSECTESNWDAAEPTPVRKGRVPLSFGQTGYVKPFLKYHTILPQNQDINVVRKLYDHLLNIRSQFLIVEEILVITNGNYQLSNNHSSGSDSHPYKVLIEEIDEYCIQMIRYLSASNWTESFSIIISQIDLLKNITSDESEIIPNIDLLAYVYLDENSIAMLFKEMWSLLPAMRSPLFQSLIFNYFSKSLEYWIIARQDELLKVTSEGSPLSVEANGFFDYMYSLMENSNKYQSTLIRFLSILICFSQSSFNSFLNNINSNNPIAIGGLKRFTTNTKKVKFLSYLKSQFIHTKKQQVMPNETCLICIENIGCVASAISRFDHSNPIIKFYLSVFEEELSYFDYFKDDLSPVVIQLFCSYFINISLIKPELAAMAVSKRFGRVQDIEPATVCGLSSAFRAIGAVPSATSIYQKIMEQNAPTLRALIRKHSRLLLKARAISASSSSKRSMSTNNSEAVSLPILINVFHAFMPNPYTFFQGYNTGIEEQVRIKFDNTDMDPIITCLVDYDADLVESVSQYLLAYLQPSRLGSFNPSDVTLHTNTPVLPCYGACGYVVMALADKIIEIDINDPRLIGFLNMIAELCKARAFIAERYNLLNICDGDITKLESLEIRQKLYSSFETAFLICMCSTNIDIYKVAVKALKSVLECGFATYNNTMATCPLLFNSDQYKEFFSESFIITGQVALQKRIRKIVLDFKVPTDGIMKAWEIILGKFTSYDEEKDYRTIYDKTRRNFASLLSCLCDCIIASDPETNTRVAELIPVIEDFISQVVNFLSSPNIQIREAAREILSREFSIYALPSVFTSIETLTKKTLETGSKDQIIRMVDTVTSLIKSAITRCCSERIPMSQSTINVLHLIMVYLNSDTKSNNNNISLNANDLTIIKMRIRAAKVCSDLVSNQDIMSLRLSSKLRYQLITILLSWFEKATFGNDSSNSVGEKSSQSTMLPPSPPLIEGLKRYNEADYIYSDYALESIKAVSLMSRGVSIEVQQNITTEEDYLEAKSTICGGFFSLLLRGLEKYHLQESTSNSSASQVTGSATNGHANGSFIAKTISSTSSANDNRLTNQRSVSFCNYIIECLTNLLKGNPDVGLKFGLPIGYHKNPKIRTSFIKVFTTIIQQGLANNFGEGEVEKYIDLMKFLSENPLICANICDHCPASEVDSLAIALLELFENNGNSLVLLKLLVAREIQNTTRVVDLLRRNSVASRMLALYSKKYGGEYLNSTIGPLIQSFVDSPEKYVFELSVDKIGQESKAKENVDKFMWSLSSFSNAFYNSLNIMPKSFKDICYTIFKAVSPRYPEAAITSVGSFLFLRFFCPAIVAPEAEGVILKHQPRREVRRSLLLIAKIIQNMANGSLYSLKLPLLYEKMNDLNKINEEIVSFMKKAADSNNENSLFINADSFLDQFQESIVDVNNNQVSNSNGNSDSKSFAIDQKYMSYIHDYLYNNWDEIHAKATAVGQETSTGGSLRSFHRSTLDSVSYAGSTISSAELSVSDISSSYIRLEELIESIGQPKVHTGSSHAKKAKEESFGEVGSSLYEFMSKNKAKDFGPMLEKQIVTEGVSDGLPFLICSLGLYDSAAINDTDMVVYRLFQVASKMWDHEYSMLFDFTCLTKKDSVPSSVTTKFLTLFPEVYMKNCVGVYYYNSSHESIAMYPTIMNLINGTGLSPNKVPYYFHSSYDEEFEMPNKPFGISRKTRAIKRDSRVEFTDLKVYDHENKKFYPVSIKVGQEFIQIFSTDPIPFACGNHNTYVRPLDVYHATELKTSYLSSKLSTKNSSFKEDDIEDQDDHEEFSIKLASGNVMILSSKQRGDVIRSINAMIQRYSEHSSSVSLGDTAVHSIQEVISIIANITYSSLCMPDEDIRTAAYNLGCAFLKVFSGLSTLKLGDPKEGIHFPKNNINYILNASNAFVKQSPQLTYGFIKAFFMAYELTPSNRKDLVLLYITPWVPMIYTHVYLNDGEKGPRRAKFLIREFIRITFLSKSHTGLFHSHIWKPLCEQSELANILVDEVINSAIDKRTDGGNCEEVISILTTCPSLDLVDRVIKRLTNVASVPLDETNETLSLAHAQASWVEIIVLVKAVTILLFDNAELCREFIPELLFISTSFIDMGPSDMRHALHKLIINTLYSFSNSEVLEDNERSRISVIVERFCGQRANLIFGLNRSISADDEDENRHSSALVSGIETYCGYLLEFQSLIGRDRKEVLTWKNKWLSLVIDASFKKTSVIRTRALLIMGFLAKDSVTDTLISRILEFMQRATDSTVTHDERAVDMNVCILESLRRLVEGLSPNSYWHGKLFWLGFITLQLPHTGVFQAGALLVAKCLEVMDKAGRFINGDVVGVLTNERTVVGPCLNSVDDLIGPKYSPDMFDNYIVANTLKGMLIPSTRNVTVELLQTFMHIRRKNIALSQKISGRFDLNETLYPAVYLEFLYLYATTESRIKSISNSWGKDTKLTDVGCNQTCPEPAFSYNNIGCEHSTVASYLCLSLYQFLPADEGVLLRFLRWYVNSGTAGKESLNQKFYIYSFMEEKFGEIVEHVTSKPISDSIQEVITQVMTNPEYHYEKKDEYLKHFLSIVNKHKFSNLSIDALTNPKAAVHFPEQIKYFKILLARALANEPSKSL